MKKIETFWVKRLEIDQKIWFLPVWWLSQSVLRKCLVPVSHLEVVEKHIHVFDILFAK